MTSPRSRLRKRSRLPRSWARDASGGASKRAITSSPEPAGGRSRDARHRRRRRPTSYRRSCRIRPRSAVLRSVMSDSISACEPGRTKSWASLIAPSSSTSRSNIFLPSLPATSEPSDFAVASNSARQSPITSSSYDATCFFFRLSGYSLRLPMRRAPGRAHQLHEDIHALPLVLADIERQLVGDPGRVLAPLGGDLPAAGHATGCRSSCRS